MQFCNILLFAEAKVEKSIKCMDFSVFICTFAMLYQSDACFLIAALRQVNYLAWQNHWQLLLPRTLKPQKTIVLRNEGV